LIGCGLVVARGFVAMVLGGILMGVSYGVVRRHRRLLMCRRSHPVGMSRLGVPFGGRMVSPQRAVQRFTGTPSGSRYGLRRRRGALRQFDEPFAQFVCADTGKLRAPAGGTAAGVFTRGGVYFHDFQTTTVITTVLRFVVNDAGQPRNVSCGL